MKFVADEWKENGEADEKDDEKREAENKDTSYCTV